MIWAAPRDASFFGKPGVSRRVHVMNDDGTLACWARFPAHDDAKQPAADVPSHMRCRRPGCRQRWPKESP